MNTWNDFIRVDGAEDPRYLKTFYESYLAEFPRRSIEGYSERNFKGWWGRGLNKITEKEQTISDFYKHIKPVLDKELENDYSAH